MGNINKRWAQSLVTLGVLTGLVAHESVAQDPADLVGRAGRIYRGLNSLQADFVQTIEDRSQGDTLTSRGSIIQAGANRFAMRFTDPVGEAIIIDGNHVWTYTPSTAPNIVYRSPVPSDPVYGANFLAQLLDRPRERYHATYVGRDTADGRRVDVIDLVPRSASMPFSRARISLGVDDALPRRIELIEGAGQRRVLTLSRLRPNAATPAGTFTFTVPQGVRVVAPPA
ncbi:MAG: LolA family protein [Gemmatimonadales bacterium]